MAQDPEIVIFADPRFPGGSTRAVLAEARALANAGLAAGFCPVLCPVLRQSRAFHAELKPFLQGGTLRLVDPRARASCRMAVVHHPALFTHLPPEPFGLEPGRLVLVLHHPPFNGLGQPEYDLAAICANMRDSFGTEVLVAPVGPAVRDQLRGFAPNAFQLAEEDWLNLLDFAEWPVQTARDRRDDRLTIGRHSRPQPSKFPATRPEALLLYPDDPGVRVRMLGFPDALRDHYAPLPPNWEVLPFGAVPVRDFLGSLDAYVYDHAPEWVEAFGYAVLEAIASGVPVVLPPRFRRQFGPAAIYAAPEAAMAAVRRLQADPAARASHVRAARDWAEDRFSVDLFLPRLDRIVPGWRPQRPPDIDAPPPLRVVMMTSNGVGLGHLTRLMAIARRLPEGTETAFFTLSQAFGLAAEAGYPTQFIPFHRQTGADPDTWNRALAEELSDFLALMRPDILVFDGNAPYRGLLDALDQRRAIKRVWVRRGLWGQINAALVTRTQAFDLVIEPGEIAGRFDHGPTAGSDCLRVPPVLNLAPGERLGRDAARAELQLDPGRINVAMMLGAGTNFDLSGIRNLILRHLGQREDVAVTEFVPAIADTEPGSADADGHRRISLYPVARVASGFDLMICGAGYNSFHEMMLGGIPAVFVPNEAAEMDRQVLRARYGEQTGCALMLRASDRIGVGATLDRALQPDVRAGMRRRMLAVAAGVQTLDAGGPGYADADSGAADGAAEAARLIADFARMTRMNEGFPG